MFQGGSHEEAKLISLNKQIDLVWGIHNVLYQMNQMCFQQFDLEQQIVPQTFVYSTMFEVLFHRVGVLTEEDIANIVELVKQSE